MKTFSLMKAREAQAAADGGLTLINPSETQRKGSFRKHFG
jgi:hypothetical protein